MRTLHNCMKPTARSESRLFTGALSILARFMFCSWFGALSSTDSPNWYCPPLCVSIRWTSLGSRMVKTLTNCCLYFSIQHLSPLSSSSEYLTWSNLSWLRNLNAGFVLSSLGFRLFQLCSFKIIIYFIQMFKTLQG